MQEIIKETLIESIKYASDILKVLGSILNSNTILISNLTESVRVSHTDQQSIDCSEQCFELQHNS